MADDAVLPWLRLCSDGESVHIGTCSVWRIFLAKNKFFSSIVMCGASLALLGATVSVVAAADEAGGGSELWELTTRIEDRQSGFVAQPSSQRQCLNASAKAEDRVPMIRGCRIVDQADEGGRVSFRFECAGRMSGTGDFDRSDDGQYRGYLRLLGQTENRSIDLLMSYAGRRIGKCGDAGPAVLPAPGEAGAY